MIGLSDGERISMIRSAVLIQITRVTDGRAELAWHIRAIALYAVARKNDVHTSSVTAMHHACYLDNVRFLLWNSKPIQKQ